MHGLLWSLNSLISDVLGEKLVGLSVRVEDIISMTVVMHQSIILAAPTVFIRISAQPQISTHLE